MLAAPIIRSARRYKQPQHQRAAFTLIEAAIVLVILGLLASTILPVLQAGRQTSQRLQTLQYQEQVLRAIAAYTHANGCLPCPASPTPLTNQAGWSVFGTAPVIGLSCGSCHVREGVVPYLSLGLPARLARDGWGHWLTYAVDPELALNPTSIRPATSPCLATDVTGTQYSCSAVGLAQKGFCRAGQNQSLAPQIQTSAVTVGLAALVLVSHGPNGRGSFTQDSLASIRRPFPAGTGGCEPLNPGEGCNADSNRLYTDLEWQQSNQPDQFDDVLLYTDRNTLLTTMGQRICETSWGN